MSTRTETPTARPTVDGVKGARILIVESPYYTEIAEALVEGAVREIEKNGAKAERVAVPGAFEIPGAIALAASKKGRRYDGYVALGCVIRGETSHYDIVCNNANHWLMHIASDLALPVGNAILTVDTHAQAMARAEGGLAGKGADAARACLKLIEIGHDFARRQE